MSAALTSPAPTPQAPAAPDPADAPVVVRFAALGDAVLLTVLLQALAERYGQPAHLLTSGPWSPELLGHDTAVADLVMVTSRRAPYWLTPSQWAAVRWLRGRRGPVYLCDPDDAAKALVARAVPPERVLQAWQHRPPGHPHWADWWLQIATLDPPGQPGPVLQRALQTPPQPRLHLKPAWRHDLQLWLQREGLGQRPLVLLQPGHKKTHKRGRVGTAYHDKHWPAEHWAAVARGVLATLPDAAVLVCGSQREAGLVQEVVDAVGPVQAPGRAINMPAAGYGLPWLLALAERAHSMVTVDTGPAHAAAAMDCPMVVLFGAAGWGQWLPRAPTAQVIPLGAREAAPGARLDALPPAQVLQAWQGLQARTLR